MADDPSKKGDGKQGEGATDYKALYEEAVAEAEKWKNLSRKNEGRAKANAGAAKNLEGAEQQIADLGKRLEALEAENASLKAAEERKTLVAKVAEKTGVAVGVVTRLLGDDEESLTEAATAIAEAYKAPGGAPSAPEAGKPASGPATGSDGGDWLREVLSNQ